MWFLFFEFIYSGLLWVFAVAPGLSLAAVSRGSSLVALHELLIAVASLAAKAWALRAKASAAVAHRISCPKARETFPIRDQARWILNH